MATINLAVTVQAYPEGNRFLIDGAKRPNLFFVRGNTYVFDVSDDTVAGHPLGFSETQDNVGGTAYTGGVTTSGTAGDTDATVTIVVPMDAPDTLYYYCTNHNGMSDQAAILVSGVSLVDHAVDAFATDVSIFANTIAREIPAKIESIATALKTHMNVELSDITDYTNESWETVLTDLQKFAGDVEADDNLESLIALSEGDTALTYRVMSDGEPIGELNMRDLVKALVPRISSTQAA